MPVDHREIAFEDAIEHHLLNFASYAKADPANFDRERALDPMVFVPFVKETQPEFWVIRIRQQRVRALREDGLVHAVGDDEPQ